MKRAPRCSILSQAWRGVVCVFVNCAVLASAKGQTGAMESLRWQRPAEAPSQTQNYEMEWLSPIWSEEEYDPWLEADAIPQQPSATVRGGASPEYLDGPALLAPPLSSETWIREPSESSEPPLSGKERAPLGGGGMMGMGGGGDRSPFRYRMMWQPAQAVQGQPTELGLIQHDLNLMAPVWMSDPHVVTLSGGVRADLFNTDAVFPDSGRAFPAELWNIRLGANYMRRFDNGWSGMASVNIGSGSDQPFGEMRDVNFGVMAFLRVPHRERNAWNFMLFYSPLSQIPFPIPMVAYHWQPSDAFSMNLGLPLQMTYRPTKQWTFDVSYMLLTTVHAQATYQLNEQWRFYGAFDWQNQSWFLHDRENDKERLFYYDKRLSVGVQTTVMKHVTVDLSTGYMFDRFYFNGEDYDDRDHDRLDIGDGLFVSVQAGVKW